MMSTKHIPILSVQGARSTMFDNLRRGSASEDIGRSSVMEDIYWKRH